MAHFQAKISPSARTCTFNRVENTSLTHKEFLSPHVAQYATFRYSKFIARLRSLIILKLDYPAISDAVLNALTNTGSGNFRMLHIFIHASDSRQHQITDASWQKLLLACPRLNVYLNIGNYYYCY